MCSSVHDACAHTSGGIPVPIPYTRARTSTEKHSRIHGEAPAQQFSHDGTSHRRDPLGALFLADDASGRRGRTLPGPPSYPIHARARAHSRRSTSTFTEKHSRFHREASTQAFSHDSTCFASCELANHAQQRKCKSKYVSPNRAERDARARVAHTCVTLGPVTQARVTRKA